MVPTYDMPDVNAFKETFWEGNQPLESIPSMGYKGMPKETNLVDRKAHLRNILNNWAFIPAQELKRASGSVYGFPESAELAGYQGMWMKRDRVGVDSTDFIEAVIAYCMQVWQK